LIAFDPVPALVGGALIGTAASLLLLTHGRVAGISGIVSAVISPTSPDRGYRLAFLVGLLLAGAGAALLVPAVLPALEPSIAVPIVAGLLVGFGTRLGNGCTSGHGVCGISRGSVRGLIATVTFIATGALTVLLVRVLGGGA